MEEPSIQLSELVKRPGLGRAGKPIKVRANYFEILSIPETSVVHYDVTITPEKLPKRLNWRIFQRFVASNLGGPLGGSRPVYDGRKSMYASKVLPFGNSGTFDVQLQDDDVPTARTARQRAPRDFVIKLRRTGPEIFMNDLIQFISGRGRNTENCQRTIAALDILIRHKPSVEFATVGRSFYTPQGSQPLYGGAEVWQGYYQSVRPTRDRMMINIDLSATAFYESGPLVQLVTKILGRRVPDDLRRGLSDRDKTLIEKTIKNLKIRENHREGNSRSFKIGKLTTTAASQTMFDNEDGTRIDVQTYFLRRYNKRLNYGFLPCVIVRRGTYLPMEVCDVVPGQRHIRKLNDRQTADMIKFTCQNPGARANKIRNGLNILNYRENEYLRQFGIRVSNEMAVVDARILPTPTIQYHPSSREHSFQPQFGVWNLRDKKVATGATLGSWSVVSFLSERDLAQRQVTSFIRELVNTCQDTGMNIPNKNPPVLQANPQGNIEETLKEAWLKAGNAAKAQPQLIVCILPNTGVPLYAEIKRVSDTVIGVATQCVQSKHTIQAKKQYCANVCLKINVKLGGMNSFLIPTVIPFISERPTIVIGADVTHPSPEFRTGGSERPSIAAVCGSMDARASRYAASIRLQQARTEIIADLANMVKECLKTFYQTCGRKPERILFYRDGVSEGEFKQVLNHELNAVRAACQALDAIYKPTITFVVVQKRHHTRFFPMDRNTSDRTGNCLPGTVVESDITHPFEFDFYLLSHPGLQGTCRPTHYHVLYDENGFNADMLQTLSYNLCYIYARCTRAVSLVPPIYYANLVCARARFHSRGGWSDTESSEEGAGAAASFGIVKAELQRVMYYM